MQVEVARRGGLAGVALRGTVDTAELPANVADAAEAALKLLQAAPPPARTRHPDSFQYELTVLSAGARSSVVLNETEMPEGLRPLIEAAVARGRLD
jgi:hypothetical protein